MLVKLHIYTFTFARKNRYQVLDKPVLLIRDPEPHSLITNRFVCAFKHFFFHYVRYFLLDLVMHRNRTIYSVVNYNQMKILKWTYQMLATVNI